MIDACNQLENQFGSIITISNRLKIVIYCLIIYCEMGSWFHFKFQCKIFLNSFEFCWREIPSNFSSRQIKIISNIKYSHPSQNISSSNYHNFPHITLEKC